MSKRHGRALGLLLMAALPALAQAQPVGSEFQVNTDTPGFQFNPSVSSAANGSFVVVWSNYYPLAPASIVGQRYDASGVPQGTEFPVTSGMDLSPDVAADASANFVVVWDRLAVDGTSAGVFAQLFDSFGNPQGGAFQVNSYTPNQSGRRVPSVASDPSGNFVVVWTSGNAQDGSGEGIFGQRFDASGAPLGAEFQVNSYTPSHQSDPDATMDSDGSFVVVWHGSGQDGGGVFGRRYDATGAPQGNAFQVNSYTTSSLQYLPAVAFGSNGSFIVSWVSGNGQDGDRSGIFAQRYDGVGTPQGSEFQVNSYTTNYQRRQQIAADASGNFVVAWTSYFAGQDGSGDGIFAKRFDALGNAVGSEFQVNSYTTGAQRDPSVASDADGHVVVVWGNLDEQDGSGSGVFGQRYASPSPTKTLVDTSPARLWVGLKNSDDQGTRFDLRAALYINDTLVAEGTTRCVTGITRNPAQARDVPVPFGDISNGEMTSGDSFSLKVSTRIGTNPNGSKCPGHSNAVGLRLYYDAVSRKSRFGAKITPDPLTDYFLHSSGNVFFLDTVSPTSAQAKQKDSGPVNFAGGNPWREIGTWSRVVP